jgi:hypothetical protein
VCVYVFAVGLDSAERSERPTDTNAPRPTDKNAPLRRCGRAGQVSPVGAHRTEPRLAMSFFYFKASERTGMVQPPAWLPPAWALKGHRGELPTWLEPLFANAWCGVCCVLFGGRFG